jgi:hypothetical protein
MYNILSIGRANVFVMPCVCSSIMAWLVSYLCSSITAWLVSYLIRECSSTGTSYNWAFNLFWTRNSTLELEQTSIDNLHEKEVVCEYLMLCRTTPLPTLTIYDTSFFLLHIDDPSKKFTNLTYGVWHCNVQQARPLTRRHIGSRQGKA